ncbi:hypothetical protein GCM10010406_27670 [Streptomyces thermolineatus]|uniref:Type I restriction modification DNA specificity domain-containing protein n=1 Tax=Streptomyces thermolineatus TaxID=44033 RepID=A0ABN3LTJ1_9ACTN
MSEGGIPSEVPKGWAWATLEDVVDVLDHLRVPVSAKERAARAGKVPYYGAAGQVGWIDEKIFDEDLILLGEDGVQFFDADKSKAYLISGPSWVNNHAHVLRARGNLVDRRYLAYYLNQFNYEGFANGTTRLKLTKAAMLRIPVMLPPLEEQRRIVAALEEQMSKIERGERGLARSSRRSVQYRRLVADLATKGKLAEPLANAGTGHALVESIRNARIGRVKGRRLQAAPLGGPAPEIAEHWTVASLDELSEFIEYGSSVKTSEAARPGDVPVLRMGNIQDGKIDARALKYIPADHPDAVKFSLEDGDLLFNRTNSIELVGKSAVYRCGLGRMAFASYLIRCRFLPGVDPEWVNLVINSPMGRRYVRSVATQQVGQANVNGTKLGGMPIPLPPEGEQRRILDVVESHHSAALRLDSGIRQLGAKAGLLRRSFLAEAFTGRLVPQDSADEPAEALLTRIRTEREAAGAAKPRRRSPRRTRAQRKQTPDTVPTPDAPPPPSADASTLATITQPTLDLEMPS